MPKDTESRLTALEQKHKAGKRALKLQRKEYSRRLADLNHENQRLTAFQEKVPSIDSYNALSEKVGLLEGTAQRLANRAESQVEVKTQGNSDRSALLAVIAIAVSTILTLGGGLIAYIATHP